MSHADRILPGIALMVAFCVVAPLIDIFAKLATATLPVAEITAARFAMQALLMWPVAAVLRVPLRISAQAFWLSCLRAVFLILASFAFVSAVAVMPVPDALTIAFVEPFILLIAGRFLFREQVGPRRIAACIVGFIGALFVIRPSLAIFGLAALWPLGTAVFFAAYILLTRAIAQAMSPIAMQFHTAWIGVLICLPVLALGHLGDIAALQTAWPEPHVWAYLVGGGVAATVSHMAISYALKFAPSSTLAPLHYLEIIAAVGLSYLIFGTFPSAPTWIGIAIIVSSGLYIIHREHRVRQTGGAAPTSDPTVTTDLSAPR